MIIESNLYFKMQSACGIMITSIENGHCKQNSNPGQVSISHSTNTIGKV